MSNFVSLSGKWYPKKESAMMKNTFGRTIESEFVTANDGGHVVKEGENFLYNGPDREAVKMLKEIGEDHLGHDFRTEPEFLQAVRNMGFNNPEEYLKSVGYDEETDLKKQRALLSIVNAHELPKETEEIIMMAGGRDYSGNKENDTVGGFGPERIRKPEEITKLATKKK